MRRHLLLVPVLSGAAMLGLCLALLIPDGIMDPGLFYSARAAVSDMLTGHIVALPLMAGVAGADAVFSMLGKRGIVIKSLPRNARTRLLLSRVAQLWLGATAGLVVICSIAIIVSVAHGSRLTWAALTLLPITLCGLAAHICIGYAVGYWWSSWFAPPVLVVAGYLRANFGIGGLIDWYNGAGLPWSVYQHPTPAFYFMALAALVCLTAVGLLWLLAQRTPAWITTAAALSVACLVAITVSGNSIDPDVTWWQNDETTSWPCHALPEGTTVCISPERPADIRLAIDQLTPLVPQFLALDPTLTNARWMPEDMVSPGELAFQLPLGQDISTWDQADTAASNLNQACLQRWFSTSQETSMRITNDELALAAWLSGDQADKETLQAFNVSIPVNMPTAQGAYNRLVKCDY